MNDATIVICWDNFTERVEMMPYRICNPKGWHNVIIRPPGLKNVNDMTVEYWKDLKPLLNKEFVIK